ncbi:MAG: YoaK family protein [Acidimicrobiales bacterium]
MSSDLASMNSQGYWSPTRRRDGLVIMLTLVTGSVDAIGLTRLGGVFTSVMTGNMVFLGISAAKHDSSVAIHTGVAFVGYIIGSLVGTRIAGHAQENEHLWPRPIVLALGFELAILGVFAVWWEITAGMPTNSATYAMLGLNAAALGIQSSAVLRFGISGLSTTYLTGTLTQLVASLSRRREPIQGRSILILLALIAGAGLGAVVAIHAPKVAPLVPLVILAFVVSMAEISFHRSAKNASRVSRRGAN